LIVRTVRTVCHHLPRLDLPDLRALLSITEEAWGCVVNKSVVVCPSLIQITSRAGRGVYMTFNTAVKIKEQQSNET